MAEWLANIAAMANKWQALVMRGGFMGEVGFY
jgi:hypothetical protein